MAENSKIKHKGVVTEASTDLITVKLEPIKTCTTCRAKVFCGADTAEKVVEVKKWDGYFDVGDEVTVLMKESLGFRALLYGYLGPFLALFISLVLFLSIGIAEGLAAIFAISVLGMYYGALYLYRDSLKKQFTFNIKK